MATRQIVVRMDESAAKALDYLTSNGTRQSEAVRRAVIEAALRETSRRMMDDPEQVAEAQRVQKDMEDVSSAW